jgi:hypothetical protein
MINKQLANRMTLRLIASIAFADALSHIAEIYASSTNNLPLGSTACAINSGFRVFSRTFYCFTNIAICFHLYRNLVLLKKSTWKFEVYTWIFTILIVCILTLVYWSFGAFTGVLKKVGCNPGADNKTLNTIFLLMAGFINLITAVCGIVTTIVGRNSLNIWIKTYAESRSYQGEDPRKFKKERMKMAERAFLYPLATCITLPIEATFLILYGCGYFIFDLGIPKAITLGLSGLLTGIAFAIDPATHKAFSVAYSQITGKVNRQRAYKNGSAVNNSAIPLADKY